MEREPIREFVDILKKKSTHNYKIGDIEIRFNNDKKRADVFKGDIKIGYFSWKDDGFFRINDKGTDHDYDYYDSFFGVCFDMWASPMSAIMLAFMRGII